MLQIKIICVGKLKEKFYLDASEEYKKRLTRFCKLKIIEVNDEKAPDSLSIAQLKKVKDTEGNRILKHIRPSEYTIALSVDGFSLNSVEWSNDLQNKMNCGNSNINFLIGGSNGLSDDVISQSNEQLSFSKFTFCHQLMRVVLLEQIYRSMKILANESYHK